MKNIEYFQKSLVIIYTYVKPIIKGKKRISFKKTRLDLNTNFLFVFCNNSKHFKNIFLT